MVHGILILLIEFPVIHIEWELLVGVQITPCVIQSIYQIQSHNNSKIIGFQ